MQGHNAKNRAGNKEKLTAASQQILPENTVTGQESLHPKHVSQG